MAVCRRRNEWLLQRFGKAEGEGLKFILSKMRYLASNEPMSNPSALIRTVLKYTGYRLGFAEAKLSNSSKRRASMSPYYWQEAPRPTPNKARLDKANPWR